MKRDPVLVCATLMLLGAPVMSQEPGKSASFVGEAKDAWITGKVEMAYTLNEHLNPFHIDTDVESGVVTLSGEVATEIERDLAEEIAKGIDGVVAINDKLEIGMPARNGASRSADRERRNFPTWFDDATTTAAVKAKLVANSSTEGFEIDVDTREDIVTLSGRVATDEQKDLAGELARNTGDVKGVRNLLVVADS
jgi:hyperosmotically inducible protein